MCIFSDAKAIHFHCVGLKGNLKFLAQSLKLTRHPGKEEAPGIIKVLMHRIWV